MSNARRVKLLYIDQDDMLDVVRTPRIHQQNMLVKQPEGLPDGVEVLGAWYEFESNSFVFKLAHESWECVEPGKRIPVIGAPIICHTVQIVKTPKEWWAISDTGLGNEIVRDIDPAKVIKEADRVATRHQCNVIVYCGDTEVCRFNHESYQAV